ncbi:MAG: TonB-dependent receptor, partial [Thermoflexibacter sp.]|nr:TonB-dependent receptor [Thermoflexibacter sp.]
NFYKSNIDEITNLPRLNKSEPSVSVAGFTQTTLRESPSIVTLITSEEIREMGAKDILDVIRLVPGLDIAFDVQPAIMVRGNGGSEAKILFQIDGQSINDISFGYSYIGQRLPLQTIDRIEIIRGAGSAIYGGMAGLAVINIITKKIRTGQLLGASAQIGVTQNGLMRNNLEFWALQKYNSGIEFSLIAGRNNGKMTDVNYVGGLQNTFVDNKRFSEITSDVISFIFNYKKLSVNVLYNNYDNRLPQLGDAKLNIKGLFGTISYRVDISEKLVLHTNLSLKQQNPYNFTDIPDRPITAGAGKLFVLEKSNTKDTRLIARSYLLYQFLPKVTITGGVEAFTDNSQYQSNRIFGDGRSRVGYTNLGAFAEANIQSKFANLTVGARVDKYTNISPVVVPRLAITKAFEKVHFKALYNEAFKTPTIQNIQFSENQAIRPERFQLIEFEAGYNLFNSLQLNANIYNILIKDFIAREDIITGDVQYRNIGNSGTQGVELEARYRKKWGYINIGYSFYRVSESQPSQKLPLVSQVFSGIPAQKATLQATFQVNDRISLSPTILYTTNKFKIASILFNPTDSREYAPETLVNFSVNFKNILVKNLTLSATGYNLLNQANWYVPWKIDFSSEIELPAQSREFLLKLMYEFGN